MQGGGSEWFSTNLAVYNRSGRRALELIQGTAVRTDRMHGFAVKGL